MVCRPPTHAANALLACKRRRSDALVIAIKGKVLLKRERERERERET